MDSQKTLSSQESDDESDTQSIKISQSQINQTPKTRRIEILELIFSDIIGRRAQFTDDEAHKNLKINITTYTTAAYERSMSQLMGKQKQEKKKENEGSIIIKVENDPDVKIEFDPLMSVGILQDELENVLTFPKNRYKLFFGDKEMLDSKSLAYYKVTPSSVLTLIYKPGPKMQIGVKNVSGKTLELAVSHEDSILEIKRLIFESQNIPIEQQNLVFAGKTLFDNALLQDYNITKESVIFLMVKNNPKGGIGDYKFKMEDNPYTELVLDLKDYDQIILAKQIIFEKMNIPIQIMALFTSDGQEMTDDTQFKQYDINQDKFLKISTLKGKNTAKLTIAENKKNYEIKFDGAYLISTLQYLISSKANIKPEDQILSLNGHKILDNDQTCDFFGIKDGSQLIVDIRSKKNLKVYLALVGNNNNLYLETIEMQSFEKFISVKEKIKEGMIFEEKEGIEVDMQKFFLSNIHPKNEEQRTSLIQYALKSQEDKLQDPNHSKFGQLELIQLDDKECLQDHHMKGNNLIIIRCMEVWYFSESIFAKNYDYTFSNNPDTQNFVRGGRQYLRPIGWQRFALRAEGQFDEGDDTWLGSSNQQGEYSVSYNGTDVQQVQHVVKDYEDLKFSQGQTKFLQGVYSTTDIKIAVEYAQTITYKDQEYYYIIQNRINAGHQDIVENKDNSFYFCTAEMVRPYGICIQKQEVN